MSDPRWTPPTLGNKVAVGLAVVAFSLALFKGIECLFLT